MLARYLNLGKDLGSRDRYADRLKFVYLLVFCELNGIETNAEKLRRVVTSQTLGSDTSTYLLDPDWSCDFSDVLGFSFKEGQKFFEPTPFIVDSLARLEAFDLQGHRVWCVNLTAASGGSGGGVCYSI